MKKLEELNTYAELDAALGRATRNLSPTQVTELKMNPQEDSRDSSVVAHAKALYRKLAALHGVDHGPRGSLMHHPV
jgi:hypothetical protein